jgi:CRP-like cAMP-binding protein
MSPDSDAMTRTMLGEYAVSLPPRPSKDVDRTRRRAPWSRARLNAAVAVARPSHVREPSQQLLRDEVELFEAIGVRREALSGASLAHRGRPLDEVHLVERGAAALTGDYRGRRPILDFMVHGELCGAVPALLHQASPWDAVTVVDSSVISVSTEVFSAAVRGRWVDRWATRTLTWLAEIGTRITELDALNFDRQVAALLLRSNGGLRRRTIADVLDLDDATAGEVLGRLERLGAVRIASGRIWVGEREVLSSCCHGAA